MALTKIRQRSIAVCIALLGVAALSGASPVANADPEPEPMGPYGGYGYQQPDYYQAPQPDYYQAPAPYQAPYQAPAPYYSPPADYSYQAPAPQYYSPPADYSYQAPAPQYYSPPADYSYQAPAPQYYSPPADYSYQAPAPQYYSPPADYSYQAPQYYSPPADYSYQAPAPQYYSPPADYGYKAPAPQYYKADYYKPEYYKKEYYPEYYDWKAVHYVDFNESITCGVSPATNDYLYKYYYHDEDYAGSKYSQYGTALLTKDDTAPFGKYPWDVRVTDDYENYLCAGVIVHHKTVLTHASCVYGKDPYNLRIRYGDWDVLNNYNEYEPYKSYESRVCRILPVTCPSSYGNYGYDSYAKEQYGELVLLVGDYDEDWDKYPQTKHVCLPDWPSYYAPPTYSAPAPAPYYNAPAPAYGYSAPAPYYNAPAPAYDSYSAVSSYGYNAPAPYYAPAPAPYSADYYSDCWVEGYYGSPQTELKNHEGPKGDAYSYGYSSAPKDYNPYGYGYDKYYPTYSKTPRHAQVKQVKSYSYSGSYGCDEVQEWVGVYGYDACVADKGSAIVCYVPEKPYVSSYDYSSYGSSYSAPATYQQAPTYESYYAKDIKVYAAQPKEYRKRAVVVAIVKETAYCSNYDAYGYDYSNQYSNSIKAVKVNYNTVDFVVSKFFEGALDYSCPAPKSYYPEPSYYPEYKQQSYYAPAPQYYSPPTYYQPPAYSAPADYYSPPQYYSPPTEYYSPPAADYYQPPYQAPDYSYSPPPYYQAPAPQYYQAPAPYSYEQPTYSPPQYYSAPQPDYYQPPAYQAPAPYYQAPAPYYQAPAPYYQAPAPYYQAPATYY